MPKLRFPEFREAGQWKALPLNELAVRSKLKNRDEKIERVLTNSAEFGVMDQRDYFDKDIATQGKLEGYFVVELGDYVYNPRISATAPVGPISKNNVATGVMSPLYTVFKFKNRNDDFYSHYFKTVGWHTYMQQASSTGARHDRMAISSDGFMAMPMPVASPEEQKKIADCLSSLDELITAQTRKVDALKTHKKWLMQQLFPREGETQPRLRFPEFRDAGEWKVRKLEDLAKRGSGHTPSKSSSEYYDGGIKWVSLADSKHLDAGLISTTKIEISKQGIKNSSAVLHPAGTVLISRDAGVGKCAVMGIPMAVSQHFIVWTCNPSLLSNWFLYHLLQKMKPVFERIATGSTIKTIGLPFFKELCFSVPALPEQQRIADCLNSLDDLITTQTQELETLRTQKKRGLMQQLFPSAEAVEL
jgi:type I restriction enzyme S subunit